MCHLDCLGSQGSNENYSILLNYLILEEVFKFFHGQNKYKILILMAKVSILISEHTLLVRNRFLDVSVKQIAAAL